MIIFLDNLQSYFVSPHYIIRWDFHRWYFIGGAEEKRAWFGNIRIWYYRISRIYLHTGLLWYTHREIYLRTCFSPGSNEWPFCESPNWRRKKGKHRPESGSGFVVTLKIQSENSGCYGNHPRELVEGLKAARIGLTSCPERALQGGYTTVGFKLKRPWPRPFTPIFAYISLSLLLPPSRTFGLSLSFSFDSKVRLIFLIKA